MPKKQLAPSTTNRECSNTARPGRAGSGRRGCACVLAGPTRAASLAVEPVDIGSPFRAAPQAAAIAAIVHRGLVSAGVMRVRRSVHLAAVGTTTVAVKTATIAMETTTMKRRRMKPATAAAETTAAVEATTPTAVETTATPAVGPGRPAERKGDHANHRGKGNWPHDILRF
jgi:hypothetical protein